MRKLVYELANGTTVTTLAEAQAAGDYKVKMEPVVEPETPEQKAEREARIQKRLSKLNPALATA